MCAQRSSVLMHGSNRPGVSLTRPLHAFDEGSADAPAGASSRPTATQAATSHDGESRDFLRCGMEVLPLGWCGGAPAANGATRIPMAPPREPDVGVSCQTTAIVPECR